MASASSSQGPHFQPTTQTQLPSEPAGAPAANWRSFRAPLASSGSPHHSAPQTPRSASSDLLQRLHLGDVDHTAQKIIAVCAAGSQQGSSVVDHLLEDGSFTVRALMRHPDSALGRRMAAQGAEIVFGDLDDVDSLKRGFKGAYGVYGVTDFFSCTGPEQEVQQGKNIVDAAKECGIQHLVWSTLERSEYKIIHFETKAEVDEYLIASGVPRTGLFLTFFYNNLYLIGFTKRSDRANIHGKQWDFSVLFPADAKLPSLSPQDVGGWALAAFKDPERWIGKDIKPCGELISPREYVEVFEEVTGQGVNFQEISLEVFLSHEHNPNYPFGLWRNMKWFLDNADAVRSMAQAREIYPATSTWRTYLSESMEITPPPPLLISMGVEITYGSDEESDEESDREVAPEVSVY